MDETSRMLQHGGSGVGLMGGNQGQGAQNTAGYGSMGPVDELQHKVQIRLLRLENRISVKFCNKL